MSQKIITISILFCFGCILKSQTTIDKQLLGVTLLQAADGYSFFYQKYGKLNENYYRDYTVYLYAGKRYRIYGACDDDCRDIDMKIFDGNGNLLANDSSYGDLPYTWVNVYSSGYFTVRVSMENCSREPCNFGFIIYKN